MGSWHAAVLTGEGQVMPGVCPNCMGEADTPACYGYRGLVKRCMPILAGTSTYYQTFNYCEPCAAQAVSAASLFEWTWAMVFLAGLPAAIGTGQLMNDRLADKELVLAGALVAGVLAVVAMRLLIGAVKKARHPRRPEQVTWGPAVYYTGPSAFGFGLGSVYKALRSDWLAAFVAANPDQVDDEAYHRLVGEPKPEAERPFAAQEELAEMPFA